MNRLTLVGNGFDLAHGLKTSYKDFLIWYLAECFGKVDPYKFDYHDEFVSARISHPINFEKLVRNWIPESSKAFLLEKKEIKSFIELCYNQVLFDALIFEDDLTDLDYVSINSNLTRKELYSETNANIRIDINCDFFSRIISSCIENNWVDIENEYFEVLKKCKNEEGEFDFNKVNQLNYKLDLLKKKLESYLKIEQKNNEIMVNNKIVQLINEAFKLSDFEPALKGVSDFRCKKILGLDGIEKENPTVLYVLNFNYTNTLSDYLDSVQSNSHKVEINHIHGELNNTKNPIIFGFGDEHDKEYLTFEEQGNNDLFTHIKSYQYFNTPNYRNLVRFLNSDDYQVYIMGHSCGLSDRTMFKEIFDHENCKSVKIFHYESSPGVNDFWEKTVNLGRHFSDKGRMRKLIVEFDEANAFPQCN